MTLNRIPVALALLSIAIVPVSLAAQGDTAKVAKKSTTASAAAAKPTATAQAPAAKSPTAAATEQAKCKDGSMYSGTSRQGACSSHGGVAEWITPSKNAVPKGATARCNDGTYYTKVEHQGACSGHKGVAEWLKKAT